MSDSKISSAEGIDTALILRLASILRDTELTCIEVEHGNLKVRVARDAPPHGAVHTAPAQAAAPASAPSGAAQAPASADVASLPVQPARRESDLVKSPMVGTVYLQPQPGAAAFAKVGDTVSAGQTLFVIEAMKTMNPVPAAKAGTLVEVLVGDSQPVEFGQPLAVVV